MPESDCIMDFGLRVVAAESRVCDRYTDRDCGKKAVTEPTKWALRPCGPTPCHLVCLCARLLSVAVPARLPFYTQGSWESGDMDSDRGDLERR